MARPSGRLGTWPPKARAGSATPRSYRFVDVSPAKAGRRYYRLRQDDRHPGPAGYCGVQVLDFEGTTPTAALAAYPTRFGQDLTVDLRHPTATTATLRLLDGLGREVWRQPLALNSDAAPQRVQPVCPAGNYTLTATLDGQVLRQRVVKD